MLYLASTTGRSSAQDRAVASAKGDEDRTVQVESATVEDDESDAPVEFFPIPPGTAFERDVVWGEGADVTAGVTEQLIYSNTLGTYGAALGSGKLVADDITTTVPGGCNLVRYRFPVVGKVNPAGIGGAFTVDFAMYKSCPGSVPSGSRPGLIIAGTQGQVIFIDQCKSPNADDDDSDGFFNDGCPAVVDPETGAQCLNAVDDDGDGFVNDGCPAFGPPETDVDSVPRYIDFPAVGNVPLPTNMWFGVKFNRNNAGMVVGTPPMTGFSCDQYDYPGFACDADAGGFPGQPQASFNLEIFADSACANSFTGYKNSKPSGSTFNPGTNIFLADDIQLSASGCNMIAYEVAVRGEAYYKFRMQNNCQSGLPIAGTEQNYSLFGTQEVRIARYTFDPPIALPQNLSFQVNVNNTVGSVIITGQQACIGYTADRVDTVVSNVCNQVLPEVLGLGILGAFDLTITCAGAAPVGACCDMFITDENNDSVCREVPKTNCPYPERFTAGRPVWVPGDVCVPDPFTPHPCGQAACCKPDGGCENLTLNECNALLPLDSPRKWDLGRYCNSDGQRCPIIACLARSGECTTQRCLPNAGVCTRHCTGGINPGTLCSTAADCRVCSNKKCSGLPDNTVCIGTGQGTCPAGQTCDFITCTTATPCLGGTCPTGGACPTPPTASEICSAGLIGQSCRFNDDCKCPEWGCQVNPTCCDSCPPIGCEDADCCTNVCNIDPYCCSTTWDDSCAAKARTGTTGNPPVPICDIRPSNDVCALTGRMEGARLMTTVPPSDATSDSGRATEDASDPLFGCFLNNPGMPGLQTVWYQFVATHTSALLHTCASNNPALDSLIGVFAVGDPSTPCNSLIPIGCSDDFAGCSSSGKNSKLCMKRLTIGNTYYVMVASKIALADGKGYRLDVSAPCTSPPDTIGDFCQDAQTIEKKCSGLPANTICTGTGQGTCPTGQTCILEGPTPTPAFNLADATMDPPVETCIPTMIKDKWYKYTATCSGTLSVEACGSTPGTTTNLAIYEDCLCPPIAGDPICRSAQEGANCGLGSELKVDVVQGSCYTIRLADDAENGPSGNLKIACVQVDCPAGEIIFTDPLTPYLPTDPPNGVVDAGRPHDPNNAALLQGIKTITAYGPRDALPSCFSLCETTNTGNVIDSVVQNPIGTYTITLHNPITAGALTTITYTDTNLVQSVGRFTSHPGNVKGDATTSETDVQDLIDVLNGTTPLVWGKYSGDINRSYDPILNPTDYITPADILEVIDLINGCSAYDPWDGTLNQNNSFCFP
jgi:hypothetical protein